MPSPHLRHFSLDPNVAFLNNGSFGATPRVVLDAQSRWRAKLEAEPVDFFERTYEPAVDEVRRSLAAWVGAQSEDLAFVPNATAGVNTVLRSLTWSPGDEIVVTNHEYNACRNVCDFVASKVGARVVTATLPFPITDRAEVIDAVVGALTPKTKLVLLDHVTSATALVLPLDVLVAEIQRRGIDVLVDGAHAPGMLHLDLDRLGAAYYTGNLHKWAFTPKSAALLHVRRDRQDRIRPLAISHGANSDRADRSRFSLEFDWTGTHDPTPYLCLTDALAFVRGVFDDGFHGLRRHNDALARRGRDVLLGALHLAAPAPDAMLGSMAAFPLRTTRLAGIDGDALHARLRDEFRIQVPITRVHGSDERFLRISAQIFNALDDYERLARALTALGR